MILPPALTYARNWVVQRGVILDVNYNCVIQPTIHHIDGTLYTALEMELQKAWYNAFFYNTPYPDELIRKMVLGESYRIV